MCRSVQVKQQMIQTIRHKTLNINLVLVQGNQMLSEKHYIIVIHTSTEEIQMCTYVSFIAHTHRSVQKASKTRKLQNQRVY